MQLSNAKLTHLNQKANINLYKPLITAKLMTDGHQIGIQPEKRSFKQTAYHIYDVHYKKLLIITILMLVLAVVQIGYQVATTGDFVSKGISLKGGSTITIVHQENPAEIESYLKEKFPTRELSVLTLSGAGENVGVIIETDAQEEQDINDITLALEQKLNLKKQDLTIEVTGSSIGNSFFQQVFYAVIGAFILMSLVVFIYFRTFIPSCAVVLAAFSDIVITLAIFNLTGMRLSTAGVAAFLMLIGYSVDTDILLTSRVLRHNEGTVLERVVGSIKTGLTMLSTTFVAVLPSLFITNNPVIQQIMLIIFIGLLVDVPNTYIQNAAILRIYMEKKHAQRST